MKITGKSFSEVLKFASVTSIWQKIGHWITGSVNENSKLRTCCVQKLFFVLTFRTIRWTKVGTLRWTQHVLSLEFSCTGDSMNNLLSYCGLVEVRINASEKD